MFAPFPANKSWNAGSARFNAPLATRRAAILSIVATRFAGGPKKRAQVLRTRRAGEVLVRAVEVGGGLAGVEVTGGDEERVDKEGDGEGARRWRRRSVASEGVRTGRVDQEVAVEREVVERAGEEAVKVAVEIVSVVDVAGDDVG